MTFARSLTESLAPKHLLKHPFYQAWNAGTLPLDVLRTYARQYFHHVAAFPRYLSATHSNCEQIQARQVLLDNLCDEEKGAENHPELWLRFAEGLGVERKDVHAEQAQPQTRELVDTFMSLSRKSYASGLGALYAYEQQVPEVATAKIDGLKKFYGVTDERGLQFFTVHQKADVWHSQEVAALMDALPADQQAEAKEAAHRAADALWGFLSGIQRECGCM
ncbi:MAG: CADD family putative folate metabolism protein [Myxococcota bacterium]